MRSAFLFDPSGLSGTGLAGIDLIHLSCIPYLCGKELPSRPPSGQRGPVKILLSFPFISKGGAFRLFCERFREFAEIFDGFTLQNLGDHETLTGLFTSCGLDREEFFIAGDAALNVTNRDTALFWKDRLDSVAILPELPLSAQKELALGFPDGLIPEIVAPAAKIVMRSEHCFAAEGNSFHCGKCGRYGLDAGSLFDVNRREFPIITNPVDCNSLLLFPGDGAEDISVPEESLMLRVR